MRAVSGRIISSSRLREEWDDADCLCQGKVPENKRIDVEHRIFNEKKQKHVWKVVERSHQDCPIHGLTRRSE